MKRYTFFIMIVLFFFAAGFTVAEAVKPGHEIKIKSLLDIQDQKRTPFQKALHNEVDKQKEKEKKLNKPCERALIAEDQARIDKFCKDFPSLEITEPSIESIENGKGKKFTSTTKIGYKKASKKNKYKYKWDRVVIKRPEKKDFNNKGAMGSKGSIHKKALFSKSAKNDDEDCINLVTGQHLRGAECFDLNGKLKGNMEELVDEDCSTGGDSDGDGQIDEDDVELDPDGKPSENQINNDKDCIDLVTGEHLGGVGIIDGSDNSCFELNGELKNTLVKVEVGCIDSYSDSLYEDNPDDEIDGKCYKLTGPLKGDLKDTLNNHGENGCIYTYYPPLGGAPVTTPLEGDPTDSVEDLCYYADNEPKTTSLIPVDQGCLHIPTNTLLVGDDSPDGCIDDEGRFYPGDPNNFEDDECWDSNNTLKEGMTTACIENDCYDETCAFKDTSLAELINEDGTEEEIDDDGDGMQGEDCPEDDDFSEYCKTFLEDITNKELNGGEIVADECDLTTAIIYRVNREKGVDIGPALTAAEDNKYVLPDRELEYGTEEREITIEEELIAMCEPLQVIDDETGQCILASQVEALEAYRAAVSENSSQTMPTISAEGYAMMGFTFAPPVLEWKLRTRQTFLGIEVFEAWVGYEFAVALGLRLPVKVHVNNLPLDEAPGILAEQNLELETAIEPFDFKVGDFTEFCNQHALYDEWYIGNCTDRFAFPDPFDLFPFTLEDPSDTTDADEFVARMKAKAGVFVEVFGVDLISWGLNIDMDFAESCTYFKWLSSLEDVLYWSVEKGDINEALKTIGVNCGSFTTPFGMEPDPTSPIGENRLRVFPFLSFSKMIRADCAEALAKNEVIWVGPDPIPLCTSMIVGIPGASMGLGLGIEIGVGSQTILSKWSSEGDAEGKEDKLVEYTKSSNELGSTVLLEPVKVDNYDPDINKATIKFDEFTYVLDKLQIRLKGKAMFGGLLTVFPDFPEFTIHNFIIPLGLISAPGGSIEGIPIPMHPGTEPTAFSAFVRNYALSIDVHPTTPDAVPDPNNPEKTLKIKPGDWGQFTIEVKNIGTVIGNFDNFTYTLSGSAPNGSQWETDPSPNDLNQLGIDELPKDVSTTLVQLSIKPFKHYLTEPGIYDFTIKGDSEDAKEHNLSITDPLGNYRIGASGKAYVQVMPFYDVQVVVDPKDPNLNLKPGIPQEYTVTGTNLGNVTNSMSVTTTFIDYNEAGCTLKNMGMEEGCEFRAVPTKILDTWTTVNELTKEFKDIGPGENSSAEPPDPSHKFIITVPRDWAGMEDTTYKYRITVESTTADEDPPPSSTVVVEHEVIATKESMSRYIAMQIVELIQEIENANVQGIKTGGLLPISMYPAKKMIDSALTLIQEGKMDKASNPLNSNVHIMEAFIRALNGFDGSKIPVDMHKDWNERAELIIIDLKLAAECKVTPALL